MTPIDRYVAALKDGNARARVRQCYGRIVRIRGDGTLALTEEPDRRIVMIMGPSSLSKLLGRSANQMLSLIGYSDQYVLRKLNEGYSFKLVVFSRPAGRIALANWSNTIDGAIEAYPELAEMLARNRAEIKSTSLEEFQAQSGFNFAEIDASGASDPRFMTVDRLLLSDGSASDCRRFLYHVTRLSELYTGTGVTMNAQGEPGVREYIMRNRPISRLDDVRVIELGVELPNLSESTSRTDEGVLE